MDEQAAAIRRELDARRERVAMMEKVKLNRSSLTDISYKGKTFIVKNNSLFKYCTRFVIFYKLYII